MPRALACQSIYKKVIELHQSQGMTPQQILRQVEGQVGQNTVYRWIRDWKAEQEKAQKSKEIA